MDKKSFHVEIPTEKLDSRIEASINRGERYVKHKNFKKVAAACILIGGLSIVNYAKPALAESIPVIGIVIQEIDKALGINKDYKDYVKYAQKINKIAKDNGIQVKVNEAIIDDHNHILLSYEIKNESAFTPADKAYFSSNDIGMILEGIKRVSFQPNYNIAPEEAEKLLPSLSKDGKMLALEETGGAVHGKFIDDHTFIGISEFDLSSFQDVPNNFKMKVDINKIKFLSGIVETGNIEKNQFYSGPSDVNGKWNLEFEVKKSIVYEVKTVKPNISSENVTIKDITITPFTADVSVKIDFSKINKLKVVDENNKEYENYNTINKKEMVGRFSDITFRFTNINKNVKNLKLIFLNDHNEEVFSCSVPME
ncbi:protein of unknown function [Clostridium amylolyticum]|uniref:DUF4179 domain-containing protein n=1 Tax=Clostridium amylolyticum TaxID=1121298 RepID=A0A1M6BIY5_9CLOT|nr:DUF4179 domain-containing protein [Clostridium amylolyticum]SHI48692.1 protein of unknown function [Clostridium amylolyticum]